MKELEQVEILEKKALVKVLLIVDEKDTHVGALEKDEHNPKGLASDTVIRNARKELTRLSLIEEVPRRESSGPGREKIYLVITEKGKRVASLLRETLSAMHS